LLITGFSKHYTDGANSDHCKPAVRTLKITFTQPHQQPTNRSIHENKNKIEHFSKNQYFNFSTILKSENSREIGDFFRSGRW